MSASELLVHEANGILTLTIARDRQRNAITPEVMQAMTAQFRRAQEPGSTIRAIVLTGEGEKAFCVGADLHAKPFESSLAFPRVAYTDIFRAARETYVPIIARVNGLCLGGGIGLLAMCDLAVADADAKFGMPEVKIGVFPMMLLAVTHSLLLPRHLREMAIRGNMIDAAEAERIGLVNHVAEAGKLDDALQPILDDIVQRSPTAIRRGKYVLAAIDSMTFEQQAAFLEGQLSLLSQTEDAREGVTAFREKRAPNWTGR